jgi:hypothetical protein
MNPMMLRASSAQHSAASWTAEKPGHGACFVIGLGRRRGGAPRKTIEMDDSSKPTFARGMSSAPATGTAAFTASFSSTSAPGVRRERRAAKMRRRLAGRRLDDGMSRPGARVWRLVESIRRDAAEVARAAVRAGESIEALTGSASSSGVAHGLRHPERHARRRPASFLGGAILLGLAALNVLRRSRVEQATPAPSPAAWPRFAETQMQLRDRPSGYFSARGEGTLTNTPQTSTVG